MNKRSLEAQSVIAYAKPGEGYWEAWTRLERLRAEGKHPSQMPVKRKRDTRRENRMRRAGIAV